MATECGTAVACDRTHTPVGIFQPLSAHSRATSVLLGQIAALSRAAVSLRECLLTGSVELEIPVQVFEEEDNVDACAV